MYDFEDYYEPSEDEILIEETVEKLKANILERAKSDIESRTKEVEQYKEQYKTECQKLRDKEKENKDLKKKIEDLETRLNSKLHEIPNHKYNVGDEVYIVGGSWGNYVHCPTCNGKGKIKVTTQEYGEIEAVCPDCVTNKRYKTKVEYRITYPVKTKISTVDIHLSANEGLKICYGIGSKPVEESHVFETLEECREYCDTATELSKQNALKELQNC